MSWAALLGAGLKLLAALAEWWRDRQLIDAGKAEQKADDQGVAIAKMGEAHDIENRLDAAGDAGIDGLRDKWTRKP